MVAEKTVMLEELRSRARWEVVSVERGMFYEGSSRERVERIKTEETGIAMRQKGSARFVRDGGEV